MINGGVVDEEWEEGMMEGVMEERTGREQGVFSNVRPVKERWDVCWGGKVGASTMTKLVISCAANTSTMDHKEHCRSFDSSASLMLTL